MASSPGTAAQSACPWYCQNAHAVSSTAISRARSTEPRMWNVQWLSAAAAAYLASSRLRCVSANRCTRVSAFRHAAVPTVRRNRVYGRWSRTSVLSGATYGTAPATSCG